MLIIRFFFHRYFIASLSTLISFFFLSFSTLPHFSRSSSYLLNFVFPFTNSCILVFFLLDLDFYSKLNFASCLLLFLFQLLSPTTQYEAFFYILAFLLTFFSFIVLFLHSSFSFFFFYIAVTTILIHYSVFFLFFVFFYLISWSFFYFLFSS